MAWRFLVVDPDPQRRALTRQACESSYALSVVDEAEDGRAALRSLSSSRVQAVVTAWRMPGMDGEALLQALRRNPVLARKPMLIHGAPREDRAPYGEDRALQFLDSFPQNNALPAVVRAFVELNLGQGDTKPPLIPSFGAGRKIIFLGVNGSARGPMAEGLAQSQLGNDLIVASAGFRAAGLHPLAVRAMAEIGLDISALPSRAVRDLDSSGVELVVNLCFNEIAPILPGRVKRLDWPMPDPAKGGGTEDEQWQRFRQVRDNLSRRVGQLALELRKPVMA